MSDDGGSCGFVEGAFRAIAALFPAFQAYEAAGDQLRHGLKIIGIRSLVSRFNRQTALTSEPI